MNRETELRQALVEAAHWLHAQALVDGTAGNLSARLTAERFLVTPSGLAKRSLQPEQLLLVNAAGKVLEGGPRSQPTTELPMHLEAYRRRPDINAVVHAHPLTCVALSIAGIPLTQFVIPEAVVVLGIIPTLPYSTPSSEENRYAIAEAIQHHDALILQYHGTLTVGRDVTEACLRLETLEHTAKIVALAKMLGHAPPLPPEQALKLLEQRVVALYRAEISTSKKF